MLNRLEFLLVWRNHCCGHHAWIYEDIGNFQFYDPISTELEDVDLLDAYDNEREQSLA